MFGKLKEVQKASLLVDWEYCRACDDYFCNINDATSIRTEGLCVHCTTHYLYEGCDVP